MHSVDRKCLPDCQTIHHEIARKTVLIICAGRSAEEGTGKNNNWFGLSVSSRGGVVQSHEEAVAGLLARRGGVDEHGGDGHGRVDEPRRLSIAVYLQNDGEEGQFGCEDVLTGRRGSVKKSKVLLELWSLTFRQRSDGANCGEEEAKIPRLYKQASYFMRSIFAVLRLLPAHAALQSQQSHRSPFALQLLTGEHDGLAQLRESVFEGEDDGEGRMDESDLGTLQTLHGELHVSVAFRTNCAFYSLACSAAIRVPRHVIAAEEVQVRSSPSSGDWVDMGQYELPPKRPLQMDRIDALASRPRSAHSVRSARSAHSGEGSSNSANGANSVGRRIVPEPPLETRDNDSSDSDDAPGNLADFIKTFERPDSLQWTEQSGRLTVKQLIHSLDQSRSQKIHFDRWLEEVEIALDQTGERGGMLRNGRIEEVDDYGVFDPMD